MELLRGQVRSVNDPKGLGRVQLRVLGYHTDDKGILPDSDLPWCEVMSPLDGNSEFGTKYSLNVGAWVYCWDLGNGIEFLILGMIQTKYLEKGDTGFSNPTSSQTSSTNPYNHIYKDEKNNILEIDATDNQEKIRIQHSTGTVIELETNGNVRVFTNKETNLITPTFNIIGDQVNITGNVQVDQNVNIDGNLTVSGTITSSTSVTAPTVTGTTNVLGGGISLNSHVHGTSVGPS